MSLVYRLLERLPELIGMRRVGIPQILEVREEGVAGLSGFVFIMESHISIHTYAERGFLTMDIYSCKEFDTELALTVIQETFLHSRQEVTLLERGKSFYQVHDEKG